MARDKSLIGSAGEHFVLYRLHRAGLLAALAPRNTPTTDVLVFADEDTVVASVQVKTRSRGGQGGWPMSKKHETLVRPRLFYAFADMEPEDPVTFIVPSRVVADVVTRSHKEWLARPGRTGEAHRDSDMRQLLPSYAKGLAGYPPGWMEQYRERWDLLRAAATSAPATDSS